MGCIQKSPSNGVPVYYIINGQNQKNRRFLEMAKSEDSANTIHVDFGQFLAISEHSA